MIEALKEQHKIRKTQKFGDYITGTFEKKVK